jgi:hypothetical protein
MQFSIIPLTVETRGEIITNNLAEFRELVREALSSINRDLKTDEEFGQAELDVEALKAAEESVREAAIKSFDDQLKALVDALNQAAEEIRVPRLELERLITARKEAVKSEIIEEHLAAFDIDPMDARRNYLTGLQNALKRKRTLESMRKACEVFRASSQAVIHANRKSIATFEAAHGQYLTMDRRELELKSSEYLTGELRRRFDVKKANDERKRLEEEAATARAAEAKAKAEMEQPKPSSPNSLPTPPRAGSIPVGRRAKNGPTPEEEWAEMAARVKAAFAPIKEHRETLTHECNQRRMMRFGAAVNVLWRDICTMEVSQ